MGTRQIDLADLALPLTLRPAAPLSDDDLMRLSERNKPYKIERNKEGEILFMTPVGGIGSNHEMYVIARLYDWAEHDAKGIAFGPNGGFNLPDGSCLSPDGAWLSLTRWNPLSPRDKAGFPPLCPDFIIEVRSKSDARRMVEAKMQTWLDNGARLAWLIDPLDRNVTIYRPNQPPETLAAPEVVEGETPVEGFSLKAARLWATP
jgi:Uma2 family endonuclease